MKAQGISVLLSALSLLSVGAHAEASPVATCPVVEAGETEFDCPWAGIARELAGETDPGKVLALLSKIAPSYLASLTEEARNAGVVKHLWGQSINYDDGAKAIIVPPAIIDAILFRAEVPARKDRVVHAGFQHTYGYLLSNLRTPYGFKRLRWVRPDTEIGFRLEKGSLSPTPHSGGLLMNLSSFAGRIAFREANGQDRAALNILLNAKGVADSIRAFDTRRLHGRRLTETVYLPGGRIVELRSDFVPFLTPPGGGAGVNTELLIYSVRDSALKLPYLISAFPVAKGFSDAALDPKKLGAGKPISTRYNAFVPGLTGLKPFPGNRDASQF